MSPRTSDGAAADEPEERSDTSPKAAARASATRRMLVLALVLCSVLLTLTFLLGLHRTGYAFLIRLRKSVLIICVCVQGTDRRNLPPSSSAPWVFRTRFWACLSIGRISMLLFRSCVSGTKSIWSRHETQALQGCF